MVNNINIFNNYPQINISNEYIVIKYNKILYGILRIYNCVATYNINKIAKLIDKEKNNKYYLLVYIPKEFYKNIYEIITAVIYTFIIGERIRKPELRFLLILTRTRQIDNIINMLSSIGPGNKGYFIVFSRDISFTGEDIIKNICSEYDLAAPALGEKALRIAKKSISEIIGHILEIYES